MGKAIKHNYLETWRGMHLEVLGGFKTKGGNKIQNEGVESFMGGAK